MFWWKEAVPPKVASDEVVPLRFLDDTFLLSTFVLHSMFVFDEVLDVQKLKDSLERLARRDGWRNLAARLRKTPAGGLEYHIPTEFTDQRQAITRSHVPRDDVPIEDDPIGRLIPKPSTQPAFVGSAEAFSPLYLGPGCPTKFGDYVLSDRSILGLHLITFSNATVVVLNWLHVAFDAMAKRAILDAWVLMMQGREDEIPTPCDFREDTLGKLGKKISSPHVLADRKLSALGMVGWALNNVVDMTFRRQENRILCLPAGFVQKLRSQAMQELASNAATREEEKPFITEGDVLVAWLARLAVSHFPRDSDRIVSLQNVFSGRKLLTGSLLPQGRPYISNCAFFFNTLLPARDILEKPLSYTARQIRRDLEEQSTREQTEAYCALLRESGPRKFPPFFGNSSMHVVSVSNWSKADFFNLDFSAASLNGAPPSKPLKPTYIQNVQTPYKFTEMFPIIGKDAHGNYWISATRVARNWGVIERALQRQDFLFTEV